MALFWDSVLVIDSTLNDPCGKYIKATLAKNLNLRWLFDHCCSVRHSTFSVLKCGNDACLICKCVRLPCDVFNELCHLPDPTLGGNCHYKPMRELLGTKSTKTVQHPRKTQEK